MQDRCHLGVIGNRGGLGNHTVVPHRQQHIGNSFGLVFVAYLGLQSDGGVIDSRTVQSIGHFLAIGLQGRRLAIEPQLHGLGLCQAFAVAADLVLHLYLGLFKGVIIPHYRGTYEVLGQGLGDDGIVFPSGFVGVVYPLALISGHLHGGRNCRVTLVLADIGTLARAVRDDVFPAAVTTGDFPGIIPTRVITFRHFGVLGKGALCPGRNRIHQVPFALLETTDIHRLGLRQISQKHSGQFPWQGVGSVFLFHYFACLGNTDGLAIQGTTIVHLVHMAGGNHRDTLATDLFLNRK